MRLEQTLAELREKFSKVIPAEPTAVMEHHVEFLLRAERSTKFLSPARRHRRSR
jgi:hypothetical protein